MPAAAQSRGGGGGQIDGVRRGPQRLVQALQARPRPCNQLENRKCKREKTAWHSADRRASMAPAACALLATGRLLRISRLMACSQAAPGVPGRARRPSGRRRRRCGPPPPSNLSVATIARSAACRTRAGAPKARGGNKIGRAGARSVPTATRCALCIAVRHSRAAKLAHAALSWHFACRAQPAAAVPCPGFRPRPRPCAALEACERPPRF